MLAPGSKAPAFSLPDANGKLITLKGLLEKGPLIVYFYPADFTPGCTKEACSIRDIHEDIIATGLQVVGISPQDRESHRRFKREHKLPFDLLCDEEKEVIAAYDVDGPFGIGTRRATFLISEDGTIVDAVLADIVISKHMAFIEKAIAMRH